MAGNCQICDERMKERDITKCVFCEESSCESCLFKYFNSIRNVKCMFCSKEYKLDNVLSMLRKLNNKRDIKKLYKENILKKAENELINKVIPFMDEINILKELEKNINSKKIEIEQMKKENILLINNAMCVLSSIDNMSESDILKEINIMKFDINTLESNKESKLSYLIKKHKEQRKEVYFKIVSSKANKNISKVKQCIKSECDGYQIIFERENLTKCSKCDIVVCVLCEREKGENHICCKETLATIKKINKISKQCPNCSTSISKIIGCNHMWCPHCYTGFNWETLKIIEDKNNTNPHYIKWKKDILKGELGFELREAYDFICGGIYGKMSVCNKILSKLKERYPSLKCEMLYYLINKIIPIIREIELKVNKMRLKYKSLENINIDETINLFEGNISKEKYGEKLIKNESEYDNNIRVWSMNEITYDYYMTETMDIINSIVDNGYGSKTFKNENDIIKMENEIKERIKNLEKYNDLYKEQIKNNVKGCGRTILKL